MKVENLKAYLCNIGMTQREFSELLDITEKYLTNIISGKKTPGRRLARDISDLTSGVIVIKTRPRRIPDYKTNKQKVA